jgi:hypothetical protein
VPSQIKIATSQIGDAISHKQALLCEGEILAYGTQQTGEVLGERDEL